MLRLTKVATIILFVTLLGACASTSSKFPVKSGGVVEYTRENYLTLFKINPISYGFQKLKPTYKVYNENDYTVFEYYFELMSGVKQEIENTYAKLCSDAGADYRYSDWTIRCGRSDNLSDTVFFVNIGRVRGFYDGSPYVHLHLYEANNKTSMGIHSVIKKSNYVTRAEQYLKEENKKAILEAKRKVLLIQTVGTRVCKGRMVGYVEGTTKEKIRILLNDQKIIYDYPMYWYVCE